MDKLRQGIRVRLPRGSSLLCRDALDRVPRETHQDLMEADVSLAVVASARAATASATGLQVNPGVRPAQCVPERCWPMVLVRTGRNGPHEDRKES